MKDKLALSFLRIFLDKKENKKYIFEDLHTSKNREKVFFRKWGYVTINNPILVVT